MLHLIGEAFAFACFGVGALCTAAAINCVCDTYVTFFKRRR